MPDRMPDLRTIVMERADRLLTLALNRPDSMNAFDKAMHDELPLALEFARDDEASDVIVLTGAGRAFSAGGDLAHIERSAADPDLFGHEVDMAKRIVGALLETDKPVVCRMNGHAVGLGATLALLCDFVYAAKGAKIGDPHVHVGLAAGDGGALAWPARIGLTRAKEYLLLGTLVEASEAERIGLINRAVGPADLDAEVDALCRKLLALPQPALRRTKALTNIELRRAADELLEQGLQWEWDTVRTPEHREAVQRLRK